MKGILEILATPPTGFVVLIVIGLLLRGGWRRTHYVILPFMFGPTCGPPRPSALYGSLSARWQSLFLEWRPHSSLGH